MRLRDVLKLCDGLAVTIHRNGELDHHYLEVSDVDEEFRDFSVIQIQQSYCPDLTDLFIWVEDPADLMEDDDVNPAF